MHVARTRQAQVIAQRLAFVGAPHQAPVLQDRHDQVQEILKENHADLDGIGPILTDFNASNLAALEELVLDPDSLAAGGHRYERLDQLAMEHLMGARS